MPDDVLLYDGECGLCSATVQFILRHDRRQTLRFAALQSPFGVAVRSRHAERIDMNSVAWLQPAGPGTPEQVLVRSDAALRVASYIGGPWALVGAARVIPRVVRDAVYDVVARHRHRLAGQKCFVPGPSVRARFIDL